MLLLAAVVEFLSQLGPVQIDTAQQATQAHDAGLFSHPAAQIALIIS